jgi:hypothetical protein
MDNYCTYLLDWKSDTVTGGPTRSEVGPAQLRWWNAAEGVGSGGNSRVREAGLS